VIPDKRYFKISEVCKIAGLKQHVLRFWETEFRQKIKPRRGPSGQRLYQKSDIENVLEIKKLLKEDGFTIPGARKFLAGGGEQKAGKVNSGAAPESFVAGIKAELAALRQQLEEKE